MNIIKETVIKHLLKKRAYDRFFNKVLKDALAQRDPQSAIAALNHLYQELSFFDFSKKKIVSEKIKTKQTKVFVQQVLAAENEPDLDKKFNDFLSILKKLPMLFSSKKRKYIFKKQKKFQKIKQKT